MKGLEGHGHRAVETRENVEDFRSLLEESLVSGEFHAPHSLETFHTEKIDTESIHIFVNDVITFFSEKDKNNGDQDNLYRLGMQIKKELFSASPNISNFIPVPERVVLSAQASRSTAIQQTFGGALVSELTYDISFSDDGIAQRIESRILTLDVSEQLDVLHQLRTVGADAISNGSWSRPALNHVRSINRDVSTDSKYSALVHIAARAAERVLDLEYKDPQLSMLT